VQKEEIIKAVQDIFIDVLENDDIVLNYNATADDIKDWDSLNNVILIVEIEKKFNFKFKLEEIQSFKNVGEMCDSIFDKINTN
jgi:acyl carrier protein